MVSVSINDIRNRLIGMDITYYDTSSIGNSYKGKIHSISRNKRNSIEYIMVIKDFGLKKRLKFDVFELYKLSIGDCLKRVNDEIIKVQCGEINTKKKKEIIIVTKNNILENE